MVEWWATLAPVERVFVAIAFPFTLLTIVQFVLELAGFGSDHHSGDGGMADSFLTDDGGFLDHFAFFSVRNLIYFLMMFGWTGLAFSKLGIPSFVSIIIGVIAGLITTVIFGWVFYTLSRFTESGNVKTTNAIGKIGSVYLSIPGKRQGTGVIQIAFQGSTQEINAMTDGDPLAIGKAVQVVEVLGGNTALVISADQIGVAV